MMKTKVTNLAIKFTEEGINILKSKGAKQSFIWDGTGFNFVLAMRGSNNFFNKVILPRTPYGRKITGAARLVREQILAALNEKLTENKINTKDLYQLSQSNLSRVTDASLYAQRAVMALFSTITAVYCIAYYFNAMGAMEEFTDNSGFNSVTSVFSALVRVFLLVFMTYNLVNLIFNTLREKSLSLELKIKTVFLIY
ncbi:MAG: hypothetical protein HWD59_13965 [Coxiellaceae bacterium]|nr:MAG: hypothetical protein HWD59_13965 [Coxiellaceae bacterium]